MAKKEIDLNNEDFGFFLQWYKEVYADHDDFDTAESIISIVMSPHKYEKYYKEYQLREYLKKEKK